MRSVVAVALAGMVIGLSACGGTKGLNEVSDSMTLAEANRKVDAEVEAALERLPAGVTTRVQASYDDFRCDDPATGAPGDKKQAHRSIEVAGLSLDQIKTEWGGLKQWWISRGFTVITDEDDLLSVEDPKTFINLGLQLPRTEDRVFLLADSPCVDD